MSRSKRLLMLYQYAAGLCDTSTGLLLIFAPVWTLRLMRVTAPPRPIEFAGFVGAFVLSIGLTYLGVVSRGPLSRENENSWMVQWRITALARTLVAIFLFSQIAVGKMEAAWIMVALTDGVLASVQWTGLARGWLQHAE